MAILLASSGRPEHHEVEQQENAGENRHGGLDRVRRRRRRNESLRSRRPTRTTPPPPRPSTSTPCAARRSEAIRVRPCVSTSEKPSRIPAAAQSTIAVNSNGPWAVTNWKKFSGVRRFRHESEHGAEHRGVEDGHRTARRSPAAIRKRSIAGRCRRCCRCRSPPMPLPWMPPSAKPRSTGLEYMLLQHHHLLLAEHPFGEARRAVGHSGRQQEQPPENRRSPATDSGRPNSRRGTTTNNSWNHVRNVSASPR